MYTCVHICARASKKQTGANRLQGKFKQRAAGADRGRQEGNRQGRLLTHTVMLRSGH